MIDSEAEELVSRIDNFTELLNELIKGNIIKPTSRKFDPLLRFIVARKWNSWYPGYFDTKGGCYAFITRDSNEDPKDNSGVIVIDPGFKYWDILRKYYNIEPHDLRKIIVSHYHPDHTMGLFELLTVMNETEYPCSYYLNRTSYDVFRSFQGKYNKINEFKENQQIELANYKPIITDEPQSWYDDKRLKIGNSNDVIKMEAIRTFHKEIGNKHNSIGLKFNIRSHSIEKELLILGDTDGSEKYIDRYMHYIQNAEVLVLHLGSFSDKGYGSGNKHLYKNGIIDILNCINCISEGHIIKRGKIECCINEKILLYNDKLGRVRPGKNISSCKLRNNIHLGNLKLVLISELGLEMAPLCELIESFGDFKWFKGSYPFFLFLRLNNSTNDKVLPCELFSTKAFDFMEEMTSIGKENLPINKLIECYNFWLFFGLFLINSSFKKLISQDVNILAELIKNDKDLLSKGKLSISNKNVNLDCSKYVIEIIEKIRKIDLEICSKPWEDMPNYKKEFMQKVDNNFDVTVGNLVIKEFLSNLEAEITSNLESFFRTIYNENPAASSIESLIKEFRLFLLDSIMMFRLLSDIFKKDVSRVNEFDKNFISAFKDMSVLISSMTLIDEDIIKWGEKELINGYRIFEPFFNFIYLEANVILEKLNPDNLSHEDLEFRCRGFGDLLKEYNDNIRKIKYFVADCGIELDLSGDIRIKDSPRDSDWIKLENAIQVFKDGKQYIVDQRDFQVT
jgi:hypothetical protein